MKTLKLETSQTVKSVKEISLPCYRLSGTYKSSGYIGKFDNEETFVEIKLDGTFYAPQPIRNADHYFNDNSEEITEAQWDEAMAKLSANINAERHQPISETI